MHDTAANQEYIKKGRKLSYIWNSQFIKRGRNQIYIKKGRKTFQ